MFNTFFPCTLHSHFILQLQSTFSSQHAFNSKLNESQTNLDNACRKPANRIYVPKIKSLISFSPQSCSCKSKTQKLILQWTQLSVGYLRKQQPLLLLMAHWLLAVWRQRWFVNMDCMLQGWVCVAAQWWLLTGNLTLFAVANFLSRLLIPKQAPRRTQN